MSSPAAVAKEKLRHCLAEVIHPSTLSVVSVYWMNIQTLSSQFTFFYFFACPPTLEREMWAMAYFKFSIAGFIANQSAQQGALCPESGPLHSSAQAELSRGPSCAPSPSTQDRSMEIKCCPRTVAIFWKFSKAHGKWEKYGGAVVLVKVSVQLKALSITTGLGTQNTLQNIW